MSAAPIRAETPVHDMADMPVQFPADPAGPAAERARFFNSGNAFNIKLPPVPARLFTALLTSDAAHSLATHRVVWAAERARLTSEIVRLNPDGSLA